jgi:hypothetical protein
MNELNKSPDNKLVVTVKYHPACKICTSGYADEVHRMRLEGATFDAIAEFLNSKGVEITSSSVARHFKFHFVIPHIKNQVLLSKIKTLLLPVVTEVPEQELDGLLQSDIDYLSALRVLILSKMKRLHELEEELEQETEGKNWRMKTKIYELIESVESSLESLLTKFESKQTEYKTLDVLRKFIGQLARLIDELYNNSSDKGVVETFRQKVAALVSEFEEF